VPFYEARPVKPFLADFSTCLLLQDRGQAGRRSWPLLEGRASPPPAAGRPFLLLISFAAASVRGPSSLNLLFGLPRFLLRLGPHSTAYAEPGPFL